MSKCERHGETPCTFGCRHLTFGVACGYHASVDEPADKWPDAWCDLCEDALQASGGEWTEASEEVADIKLMCTYCYDAARARNELLPLHARGKRTRLSEEEIASLLHHATHEMQAAQRVLEKRWGWKAMARWDFDEEARTLTFSDSASPAIIADVRLVGSYSTKSSTFQWAWKTFDEGAPEAHAISPLRVFGEVRGISKLTTANWKCEEDDGWEMASIAGYLLGAEAMYRAPFEHTQWYMLLSNLRHSN